MATINDVAKRAGVSPATVSRVIQRGKNVRPATREMVVTRLGESLCRKAQGVRLESRFSSSYGVRPAKKGYMSVLILIVIVPVIIMAIALEHFVARGLLVGAIQR